MDDETRKLRLCHHGRRSAELSVTTQRPSAHTPRSRTAQDAKVKVRETMTREKQLRVDHIINGKRTAACNSTKVVATQDGGSEIQRGINWSSSFRRGGKNDTCCNSSIR